MRQTISRLTGQLRRLRRDTNAVSAVEFAILLPVMLLRLLGTFDIARAIDAKSRTSLLSSTVSNFVSQHTAITPAILANIIQASRPVMYPYAFDSSILTISIQSIRKAPNGEDYIIDWSYAPPDAKTKPTLDPAEFTPPAETSVVRAVVDYTYNLKFAGFLFDRIGFSSIHMKSASYAVPRLNQPIEPSGFPN